jgi:peptide deformylase
MAVHRILRMGDPRLRQPAAVVDVLDTRELHDLVADMWDTMNAYDGAGLAAVQISVPLRVVVFGIDHNPRYPDAPPVPSTVLVNPEITPLTADEEDGWEGCLSVPGMRGLVPRVTRIRYRGFDPHGNPVDREAEGFHARVVRHECDHLDGILYPERIRDLRTFGFIEELQQSGASGEPGPPEE